MSASCVVLGGSGYSIFINNCFIYGNGNTVPVLNAVGSSTNSLNYPRMYLSGCSISNGNLLFSGTSPTLAVSGFNVSEMSFCNINHSASCPAMVVQNLSGVANSSSIASMVNSTVVNNFASTALSYTTQYTSASANKILASTFTNCTFTHYRLLPPTRLFYLDLVVALATRIWH